MGLQLPLSLGCVFSAVLAPHRALLPSASCFQLDTFPLLRPQAALASPGFPLPEMLILFWQGAHECVRSLCTTWH